MKLPLFLLCFVFCFPVFGQKIKKIDWLADNQFTFKPSEREMGDGRRDMVEFTLESTAGKSVIELFSRNYFEPVVDTSYKIINQVVGYSVFQDTFYIERISDFIDDKGNAKMQYFYPNGQLQKNVNYVSTHDEFTYDHSSFRPLNKVSSSKKKSRTLEIIGSKQRYGVADGIVKYYFPTGELQKVEEYSAGILNGKFQTYYQNGQLKEERIYNHNCPVKTWKSWYPNGQLKSKQQYNNCQLIDTTFIWHENGQLGSVSPYKNGYLNGEKKVYYENGSLMAVQNFKIFKSEKSDEILFKEAMEEIVDKKMLRRGSRSSRNGWILNNQDTLVRAKQMAQLEKYYFMPYGYSIFYDANGNTFFEKEFTKKSKMEFMEEWSILQKAAWTFNEKNNFREPKCIKSITVKLPFRVGNEKELKFCLSNLAINIPDTSIVELSPPFEEKQEIFTQIVTLKNSEGDLDYILKYPSGQTFLDYSLNSKEFIEENLEEGYSSGRAIEYIYSGPVKIYYRNGQLKHDALYQKIPVDKDGYDYRSISSIFKNYNKTGKILINYSNAKTLDEYGVCYNYAEKYLYNNKNGLKIIQTSFEKEDTRWIKITHFHSNGNIKKKTLQKSRKLHNWQELYNQAGELIAKEKFKDGKSVRFIKH